jgi:hypothetical protein
VLGGGSLPTTHSFAATNHQLHVVVANLRQRLDHLRSPGQRLQLSAYHGTTAIRVFLSDCEQVEIVHGYKDH